jgi:hypothetical protein
LAKTATISTAKAWLVREAMARKSLGDARCNEVMEEARQRYVARTDKCGYCGLDPETHEDEENW